MLLYCFKFTDVNVEKIRSEEEVKEHGRNYVSALKLNFLNNFKL